MIYQKYEAVSKRTVLNFKVVAVLAIACIVAHGTAGVADEDRQIW